MSDARTYDIPAMNEFVADLDKKIAALVELHENAESTTKMVRTGLTGTTGGTFETVQADWQRNGTDQLAELRAIRERVANAARNYEAAERANNAMLGDL